MSRQTKSYGFVLQVADDIRVLSIPRATLRVKGSSGAFEIAVDEFPQYPNIAGAVVAHFYRLYDSKARSTIKAAWARVRPLFRFLESEGIDDDVLDVDSEVLRRYLLTLRNSGAATDEPPAVATLSAKFRIAQSLVRAIAKSRGLTIARCRNPFPGIGRSGKAKPHIASGLFLEILRCAKQDVACTRAAWATRKDLDPSSPVGRAISLVESEHGGLVPLLSHRLRATSSAVKAVHTAGRKAVQNHMYATPDTLLPFMILIGYGTAANSEALTDFPRDCMTPDPLFEATSRIQWQKGRAASVQSVTRSNLGRYSIPSLIETVQQLTAPLLRHVQRKDRDRLFIAQSTGRMSRVSTISSTSLGDVIRRFCKRHGLRDSDGRPASFRMDSIRGTVLADLYRKTKDVLAVKRFANHSDMATTWQYVVDRLTDEMHDRVIARVQNKLLQVVKNAPGLSGKRRRAKTPEVAPTVTIAHGAASSCRDPFSDPSGHRPPGEVCHAWFAPFTNPGLIVLPEPKYIAQVILHRDAIERARPVMERVRFNRLFLPIACFIDDDILPKFSPDQVTAGRELAATLPALPDLSCE